MSVITPALNPEQRRQLDEEGYLVVDDILSADDCRAHVRRLDDYTTARRDIPDGLRLHREPSAQQRPTSVEQGADIRKISGLVNDELFRHLIHQPSIVDLIADIIGPELKLYRADALMKPAAVGSAKGVHQDAPYWPIEPMEQWSCWMPFDPATKDNGCMQVVPGSHRHGALPHVSTQDDFVIPDSHYDIDDLVLVPMKPGSGLFFHSLLVHGTAENRSDQPRRAITMSYMAADSRYVGHGRVPDYPHITGGNDHTHRHAT